MSESDQTIQHRDDQSPRGATDPRKDDRRSEVSPTDRPVPQSPEADEESVREGQEKLERVKPY